jgi:mRNA-degrading endonuclease RelE of RelBE toxin-antitoxin system
MEEKLKIEIGGVYRTHVGDLVKIMDINKDIDQIHIFNISEGSNQWVSLSRAMEHKFKTRVN